MHAVCVFQIVNSMQAPETLQLWHFLSFFPGRKIAFLFSSSKSPFVILKVPRCLCRRRQLAVALLKIAGGGNRYTLNIKYRKGSTGVNNAWERIPFILASGSWSWVEPPTGQERIRASLWLELLWKASHKLRLVPSLLSAEKDKKKRRLRPPFGMQIRCLICRHKFKCQPEQDKGGSELVT